MPRVICTRPNAGELINGVKFSPHDGGMISDEVTAEIADQFMELSGFEIEGKKKPAANRHEGHEDDHDDEPATGTKRRGRTPKADEGTP